MGTSHICNKILPPVVLQMLLPKYSESISSILERNLFIWEVSFGMLLY